MSGLQLHAETRKTLHDYEINIIGLARSKNISSDVARLIRTLRSEPTDGLLHLAILVSIKEAHEAGASQYDTITFLQQAFELRMPSELLAMSNDAYRNKLRHELLAPIAVRTIYDMEHDPDETDRRSHEQHATARRQWMTNVLCMATELDNGLADNYVYARSLNYSGEEFLGDIISKIEALGTDNLTALRDFANLYTLSDYSIEQLRFMAKLAAGDDTVITELRQHDVIVCISNRLGDYANVLASCPAIFEDGRQRTVFGEVETFTDVKHILSSLSALDIRPSTLVIAAHSNESLIGFASKQPIDSTTGHVDLLLSDPFVTVTMSSVNSQRQYETHDIQEFLPLINDQMVPSRGIDDDNSSTDNKKVIFVGCSVAQEVDANGQKIVSILEALARCLQAHPGDSAVQLFGANSGIQIETTARGIVYTYDGDTEIKLYSDKSWRKKGKATKFTVNGKHIAHDMVSEIPLRNFDKLY